MECVELIDFVLGVKILDLYRDRVGKINGDAPERLRVRNFKLRPIFLATSTAAAICLAEEDGCGKQDTTRPSYVHVSTELLRLHIKAAISSRNSSGSAFNDRGKCVGVASHCLKLEDEENHDLCMAMGMAPDQKVVQFRRIKPTAPGSQVLKLSDVIFSFDGVNIAIVNFASIKSKHSFMSFAPNVFDKILRRGFNSWMVICMESFNFGMGYCEPESTFVFTASPSTILS
ncbi:uncharacterized protein LOC122296157 [Carya illinoinensis]|uniref:uncharacterized protein LOC122296157 n=1 Tax=Carya illinoinensis TaxID=32201 RepID=UPI001C726B68|nr:uncharacterized protein LOC122296157 [Carya illinoinensis]